MRRIVTGLVIAVGLVLPVTGCAPQPAAIWVAPDPEPGDTPTPDTTPTPAATNTPAERPTISAAPCAEGFTPVTQTRASRRGPYGALRTTGSDAVALTFDDGPDPVNTIAMLEVLRACNVKATFCVNGNKVVAHPHIVLKIAAEGHTLCNHTWSHDTQLGTYGREAIYRDLKRTNDAIHAIDPRIDVAYFRAPGGMWTADYVAVAAELGMEPIDWDVDPWDWNFPVNGRGEQMTIHIVEFVKSHVRPGSIILAHDYLKPDTVEAMRLLLPWLTARYTLIALPAEPLLPPDLPIV